MTYFKKPANKLNTKIVNSELSTIPWEECSRVWLEAADQAEENALLALQSAANKTHARLRQNALKLAGIDETEASYEGDLNLDLPAPALDQETRFEIRREAGNNAIAEYFIKPYCIKSWGAAILDQLVAEYSKHKINTLGQSATISRLEYLKQNLDNRNPKVMGMYRFLMLDKRSTYLSGLGSSENKKYCNLVPLILYAHKLYNNIPYSKWERETLHYVVNASLCDAMLTEAPELTPTRALELRDQGLLSQGKSRSPQSTFSLYGLNGTELKDCNMLVKHMLLQTWAAHPTNRTKYMVLDPIEWDTMPTALVTTNIFKEPAPVLTGLVKSKTEDNPWI